ncbi:beta-1,6-N-acetylglucosaminyltransferase [Nostoc sp.]|uniref:beta-1,6-N-acetylglucosaminyltransferase n=1 Tax=Nostoc sp. TaxID=1180 RepID=UPI002FFA4600
MQTIRRSSPNSYILISHDFRACDLDVTDIRNLPKVEVISGIGGRVDFSIIQGYLNAVDWIFSNYIEFDWLINISGQDYPIQPLSKIEKFLEQTKYDGFLDYFNALNEPSIWGIKHTRERYLYQYWYPSINVPPLFKKLINRSGNIINNVQPFVNVSYKFDRLMLGSIATSPPFNENFLCYVGSYFQTLSRKCIKFLYEYTHNNKTLVDYYKKTCVPDESFIQTVLVNNKSLKLCNNSKRYIDFSNDCRDGHPRTLTTEDYPKIIQQDVHFARKFDAVKDSKVLDMLDVIVLQAINS